MKENQKKALISLKKARTSIDKIISTIEEDKYSIDIIQQNLAVIWLIKSSNLKLLENHLWTCFLTAAKANDSKKLDTMIWELLTIVKTAQNK